MLDEERTIYVEDGRYFMVLTLRELIDWDTPEAIPLILTRWFRLFLRVPHIIVNEDVWIVEGNTEIRWLRFFDVTTFVFCFHGLGFGFDYHAEGTAWSEDEASPSLSKHW